MQESSYFKVKWKHNLEDVSWFNIKNYEILSELTYGELFNEMAFRVKVLIRSIHDDDQIYPTDEWLNILNGRPLVTNLDSSKDIDWGLLPLHKNKCCGNSFVTGVRLALPSEVSTYENYLSSEHYVINLSNAPCFDYWMEAIDTLMCKVCKIKFETALYSFTTHETNKNLPTLSQLCPECQDKIIPEHYFDSLLTKVPDERIERYCDVCQLTHIDTSYCDAIETTLLAVDLKNKSDEQLVEDFKTHIGNIRKLSGIPEPNKPHRPKQATKYFEDIFNKKLIPMLDLITWEVWCASSENIEKTYENRAQLLQNTVLNLLYPPELYMDSPQPKWVNTTKRLLTKTYIDIDILDNHLLILKEDREFASRRVKN